MRTEVPDRGSTAIISRFIAGLRFEDLTSSERSALRRHLLDTLGAMIAGAGGAPSRIAAQTLAEIEGPGHVPVPGFARTWSRLSAAYLGGASAHGLELDDGYRAGSIHPGAPIIPAVLAAAWGEPVDGRTIMTAVAIGYEISTRLAEALHPGSRRRGFHNTSIVGVLGAAAATSALMGLDARRCEHALGIAASSAAGLFAFLHGGGEIKRLHPGFAAREGLFATLLARNGMSGPAGVIESKDGFLQAFGDNTRIDQIAQGLEIGRPETLNAKRCYIKPYACCRHIHPAIDAVLDIVVGEGLDPYQIAAIEVGTYAIAVEHAHGGWGDMPSAQMNYRFCSATAALKQRVTIEDFGPSALADPVIAGLCEKVFVTEHPTCESDYPRLRSAHVAITTLGGARFERYVDEPLGSTRNPLSDAAVRDKFDALVSPVLGSAPARELCGRVWHMETMPSIDSLLEASAARQGEDGV
jgi:2-methylcitrate dehydratase PrpD